MALIKLAATLLIIWLILLLLGKGGFIHLLLLNAFGVIVVDLAAFYRSRLTTYSINPDA
jgi:hypothetical protein